MKDPDTGTELTREQTLEIENRWLRHNLAMLCHEIMSQAQQVAMYKIQPITAVTNSCNIAVATSERTRIFEQAQ